MRESNFDTEIIPIIEENSDPYLKKMGMGEHLAELRIRLLRVSIVVGLVFIIGIVFYRSLWQLALYPLEKASAIAGIPLNEFVNLQLVSPMEGIVAVATLSLKLAVAIAFPLIAYEIWQFVMPGLYKQEKKLIGLILSAGALLFFAGVGVAFFIASPVGIHFLLAFDKTLLGVHSLYRVDEYIGFISNACFGFGICFETPLVMLALAWAGLISPEGIKKYWRHTLLAIAVLGALFTPPDPYTMIALSGCMAILYLGGYWLAKLVYKNDAESAEASDIGED